MSKLLIISILLAVGSAFGFTFEDMAKVKVGMTKSEVKAVLGMTYTREIPNPQNPWTKQVWYWKDRKRGLASVVFMGNRVSEIPPLAWPDKSEPKADAPKAPAKEKPSKDTPTTGK